MSDPSVNPRLARISKDLQLVSDGLNEIKPSEFEDLETDEWRNALKARASYLSSAAGKLSQGAAPFGKDLTPPPANSAEPQPNSVQQKVEPAFSDIASHLTFFANNGGLPKECIALRDSIQGLRSAIALSVGRGTPKVP